MFIASISYKIDLDMGEKLVFGILSGKIKADQLLAWLLNEKLQVIQVFYSLNLQVYVF